jgi:hypothetical protein
VPEFNSKQFVIKREDMAIAQWRGPKDDETLAQLLSLFRREKWRGQFVVNYVGNGGVNDVIFTEHKQRSLSEGEDSNLS